MHTYTFVLSDYCFFLFNSEKYDYRRECDNDRRSKNYPQNYGRDRRRDRENSESQAYRVKSYRRLFLRKPSVYKFVMRMTSVRVERTVSREYPSCERESGVEDGKSADNKGDGNRNYGRSFVNSEN